MNRFTPGFAYLTLVDIENAPTADGSSHTVQFRRVSASYFETMRIRVRRGRVFDERDALTTPATAVISQSFSDRFWPGADPIGRRVKRGTGYATVVGIVDDASDVDLLQPPEPTLYAAWTQTATICRTISKIRGAFPCASRSSSISRRSSTFSPQASSR
jgi:hypothetical protein